MYIYKVKIILLLNNNMCDIIFLIHFPIWIVLSLILPNLGFTHQSERWFCILEARI